MAEQLRPISERTVLANIGITEADLERRKRIVGLGAADLERIKTIKPVVEANVDQLTNAFFDHLTGIEEAKVLLSYRELTSEARALKRQHLMALVSCNYDLSYAEQRIRLALLYGRVGLETKVFLGAFAALLGALGRLLEGEPFRSLEKVAFLDVGIQTDVLFHERNRTILQQAEAIRELSTPVLQIREQLLLLPLIGVIDTHRAKLITEGLLKAIRDNRAKVVVMDVTGVAAIDSKVANHLLQTVAAAKLMGAIVIVTGVSAEVAQSLVAIGIDLSGFRTIGDLQGGVEHAEGILGLRVVAEG